MNKKKLVISKGYTLEVTSWENDGDNYRTKYKTVKTLEEAKQLYDICKKLFCSCNNGKGGVGNSMEDEELDTLVEYAKNHPELDIHEENGDEIKDYFQNVAYELMGNSEYYDFRICEKVTVTYSPEDVYLEEIKL